MVILGLILLLLLLIVQNKTKVDPLYYGKSSQTHICCWSAVAPDLFYCYLGVQCLQSSPLPVWWV